MHSQQLLIALGILAALVVGGVLLAPAPSPVAASDIIAISAGTAHTCAVTGAGGIKCWGSNTFGTLGDGTQSNPFQPTPVNVVGLSSGASAVAAGGSHTCALGDEPVPGTGGGVKCWGNNLLGSLGTTTQELCGSSPTPCSTVPVDVSGLSNGVAAITAGSAHTCALTTTGGVQCWGWGNDGQLGNGKNSSSIIPVDVVGLDSGVVAIAAGHRHTCAITVETSVKCWGNNQDGQLGDGTTTQRTTPVDVCADAACMGPLSDMVGVSAGDFHTCALAAGGDVLCWGFGGLGQLGDGTTGTRATPAGVTGLGNGVTISAGGQHTCVLTSASGAKCWGSNSWGQVGAQQGPTCNTSQCYATPIDVTGLAQDVQEVDAGGNHSCAVSTDGGMKCWGLDGSGQLGNGTSSSGFVPGDVVGLGPKPTPTPTPTATPCPDFDGDTLCDDVDPDDDNDGCTDLAELQTAPGSEATGGLRDPHDYWDFMDMWVNKQKDRRMNIIDIGAVVQRFASVGDLNSDPLDPPQDLTSYHVSADRTPPVGPNLWKAGPPDGQINTIELALAVVQFGHDCSGSP